MDITQIHTERGVFSYREYGAKQATPLILIHGWPETSYCWHHVAQRLDSDFRILAVDLRGAGHSNRALDKALYTKYNLGLDILSVTDKLGIEEFYLAGHDWGSAVAQEIALNHGERIKKLCLLNMVIINNEKGKQAAYQVLGKKLFYSFWYQWFQNLKGLPEVLIKDKEDAWVRFFMRGMANDIPEESIKKYVESYKVEHSITCAANLYRTMGEDFSRWKTYQDQKFQMPTKMIYGNLDPVIIKEYLIDIESCFVDISIIELDTGHFIVDEKPEEVAAIMKEFLKKD